jgi:hypothetical protein
LRSGGDGGGDGGVQFIESDGAGPDVVSGEGD